MGVPQRKQCLETPTPDPSPQGGGEQAKKSFSAPVIWLRGPALPEKIFSFYSAANHRLIRAIPPHKRGVCAIVRKCEAGSGGRDASGAFLARTNDAFAYGEVVWS